MSEQRLSFAAAAAAAKKLSALMLLFVLLLLLLIPPVLGVTATAVRLERSTNKAVFFRKKVKDPVVQRAEDLAKLQEFIHVEFSCAGMPSDYIVRARDVIEMMCPNYRLVWKALATRTCRAVQGLVCLPRYYEEFCSRDPECTTLCMVFVEKNCNFQVAKAQALLNLVPLEVPDTEAPAGPTAGEGASGDTGATDHAPGDSDGDAPANNQLTNTGPGAILPSADQASLSQTRAASERTRRRSRLIHRPVPATLDAFDGAAQLSTAL